MSQARKHQMPFGAEIQADGVVRFRLWAPRADRVALCLGDNVTESQHPMQAQADGWFELTTKAAGPGTLYRYLINDQHFVPDPASRYQPHDVHGYSQIIDPANWLWSDSDWLGRPWPETVIYELHIGSFTPEGTFSAAAKKLDYLRELGITAIELMPIADFPGRYNWGYDGVLPFAPDSRYGSPDDLKALIEAAHANRMMVFLDVVYNHFGPEGNYLHHYASAFFSRKHHTPWGKAFNFDGRHSHSVRQFFIDNALYWLEEFHFDGLRLDAVQSIVDDSRPDILQELAERVRQKLGPDRHIHLMLENDDNAARYLERDRANSSPLYDAQWNDDIHHILHILLTGESWGYYQDYADCPIQHLIRCLTEGFAYQGESSLYRHGRLRGEASSHLPPSAFISFLQNHDHIGNRPFAERLACLAPPEAIRAATALLLLAPFPPMLFMGQEWGSRQPFHFFCDFEAHLAKRVTQARRREFAHMPGFETAKARSLIPAPSEQSTFQTSVLDWQTLDSDEARQWLSFYRHLLALRQREIVPRLPGMKLNTTTSKHIGEHALQVDWQLSDGSHLNLLANLGPKHFEINAPESVGRLLYASHTGTEAEHANTCLPAWSIIWRLRPAGAC